MLMMTEAINNLPPREKEVAAKQLTMIRTALQFYIDVKGDYNECFREVRQLQEDFFYGNMPNIKSFSIEVIRGIPDFKGSFHVHVADLHDENITINFIFGDKLNNNRMSNLKEFINGYGKEDIKS